MAGFSGKCNYLGDSDIDITDDDGLIIIANNIPDDWPSAPDIHSYRSLDRNFVFAGEQIKLLVCYSANKQNSGIITPPKNVSTQKSPRQKGEIEGIVSVSQAEYAKTGKLKNPSGEARGKIDSQQDVSRGELQSGHFFQRFENSHFFARIAESNETLWSERSAQEACFKLMETSKENLRVDSSESAKIRKTSVVIDRGKLHSHTSGGVTRGAAKCCSLPNGDLVVLLQVKVGVEFMMDPTLEILQFEKYHERNTFIQNQASFNHDGYGELLNWLIPVNNPRRPATGPSTPKSSSRGMPTKRAASISSASEIFAFGHIRSYSMSSLQLHNEEPEAVTTPSDKPSLVQEDKYQFSFRSFVEIGNNGNEKLLSFRGVPLPPERFSIQCGLEGVSTPVRRWRRKLELIVPLEIHCYSVDCNTEDVLCLHIKNVSPAYAPDVVVFIDSITMVSEEASSGGPSLSLPVTCTEAGSDYRLPNLALRRGEEHSFILKPVPLLWRQSKGPTNSNRRQQRKSTRNSASTQLPPSNTEWRNSNPSSAQYAVLVSCRCNYTESKLFFRHPVSWQPRIARDLMVSISSETSKQTLASNGGHLPVQAVTLHASNMTSDDLTLTAIAPTSITSPPPPLSVRNLPFEGAEIPNTNPSCTHLCLRSRVPLGCVPPQSSVAFKLDVIPLTDGIISLDSLHIDVKEKDRTYIPKHKLKIAGTSTTASAIV